MNNKIRFKEIVTKHWTTKDVPKQTKAKSEGYGVKLCRTHCGQRSDWYFFATLTHSTGQQYGFASIGGSSHKKITTIFFCSRKVREIHIYLGCLSTELSFSCDSIPSLSNLTGFERKKLLNQVEVEFMLSEPICQTHWWFDKDCLWINWENGLTPY